MKQIFILLTITITFTLGACGGRDEVAFPDPTGKGSIRMINAIKASPDITFKIQERFLATADYRSITNLSEYDDLQYIFNFEVNYAGATSATRFATKSLKMIIDTQQTILLSGTLEDPLVTVWETPKQNFEDGDLTFKVRFAHTAESYGNLDIYFVPQGEAPSLGEAIGTLAFGEILPSVNLIAGGYVLTLTEAGLPGNIVFKSDSVSFLPGTQYTITPFDGGENTSAPIIVKSYSTQSGVGNHVEAAILDANFPSKSEFIHASLTMNSVDIYDESITSTSLPWVSGHNFKDVTNEVTLPLGSDPFVYVPAGLIAPELINFVINEDGGIRARTLAVGSNNEFRASTYLPDRRPLDTAAKLQIYNSNTNFSALDIYIVEADTLIDEQSPIITELPKTTPTSAALLPAGNYDIFLTESSEKTILAGPIRLDAELGDVFGGIIYDMVDPAILEFVLITENQTP